MQLPPSPIRFRAFCGKRPEDLSPQFLAGIADVPAEESTSAVFFELPTSWL
jgi:hypothetical protein